MSVTHSSDSPVSDADGDAPFSPNPDTSGVVTQSDGTAGHLFRLPKELRDQIFDELGPQSADEFQAMLRRGFPRNDNQAAWTESQWNLALSNKAHYSSFKDDPVVFSLTAANVRRILKLQGVNTPDDLLGYFKIPGTLELLSHSLKKSKFTRPRTWLIRDWRIEGENPSMEFSCTILGLRKKTGSTRLERILVLPGEQRVDPSKVSRCDWKSLVGDAVEFHYLTLPHGHEVWLDGLPTTHKVSIYTDPPLGNSAVPVPRYGCSPTGTGSDVDVSDSAIDVHWYPTTPPPDSIIYSDLTAFKRYLEQVSTFGEGPEGAVMRTDYRNSADNTRLTLHLSSSMVQDRNFMRGMYETVALMAKKFKDQGIRGAVKW